MMSHLPATRVLLFFVISLIALTSTGSAQLDPSGLKKYVDELPQIKTVKGYYDKKSGPKSRKLKIGMYQVQQRMHRDLPKTRVWAYGKYKRENARHPGPVFEMMKDVETTVKWENHLPKTHPLPVDISIHWANPKLWPGHGIPAVTHIHGLATNPQSDGNPDAWFFPKFKLKGMSFFDKVYTFPNEQQAATLFFHDHAMGLERLNVYMGLFGFYFIRDPAFEDPLNLPSGKYEVPLVMYDRTFNEDGSLFYPGEGDNPEHPVWVPEYFANANLVNGKLWPFMKVEPRKYRFRMLNAANARFYELALSDGTQFHQIGSDGGYLEAPTTLSQLLIAPAERFDVIIDFTGKTVGDTIEMTNSAVAPYPGGPDPGDPPTLDDNTKKVMLFKVVKLKGPDTSDIPSTMNTIPTLTPTFTRQKVLKEKESVIGQPLGVFMDGRRWKDPVTIAPTLGTTELWEVANLTNDAHPIHIHLIQFQILNREDLVHTGGGNSSDYEVDWTTANPIFPWIVINNPDIDGTSSFGTPYLAGNPQTPDANEQGWKDVVKMFPGQVTRLHIRWTKDDGGAFSFDATEVPGYVWHCAIREHADVEMMRRFVVQDP